MHGRSRTILRSLSRVILALAASRQPIGTASASDEPAPKQSSATVRDEAAEAGFRDDVLPILREHCFECHSHHAGQAKGGLMLDSRSGWAMGGDSGPAVVPGRPDESLLISAVRFSDYEMPPAGKLPDELIAKLERWVTDGAYDPRVNDSPQSEDGIDSEAGRQHWAFQPVRRTSPPDVADAAWPLRNRAAFDYRI